MQGDTEDRIRARAYALWQESGQPEGQDMQLWLEAEQQLNGQEAMGTEMGSGDPLDSVEPRRLAGRSGGTE